MRIPAGVCEICGRHVHSVTAINGRCTQVYDGQRCKGAIGSRLQANDWKECSACGGSGYIEEARCDVCEGDGCNLARSR